MSKKRKKGRNTSVAVGLWRAQKKRCNTTKTKQKKRTQKEPNARLRRLPAATKPRLCAQLILDRAAPTMIRSLESGQGTGVLQETSTQVVSSVAKMYVGDLIEEGTVLQVKCLY